MINLMIDILIFPDFHFLGVHLQHLVLRLLINHIINLVLINFIQKLIYFLNNPIINFLFDLFH